MTQEKSPRSSNHSKPAATASLASKATLISSALTLAACSSGAFDEAGTETLAEALCTFDSSEQYDVEAFPSAGVGGVSKAFIDQHQGAVGKIDDSASGSCTGTLLGDGLLLTAGHCVEFGIQKNVYFNYQTDGTLTLHSAATSTLATNTGQYERYRVGEVLETLMSGSTASPDVDYALVRVRNNPENRWGSEGINVGSVSNGAVVTSIGHPATDRTAPLNFAKVAAIGTVLDNAFEGGADLEYSNYTCGGNSGGPIFTADGRISAVVEGISGGSHHGSKLDSIADWSEILRANTGEYKLYNTSPTTGEGEDLGTSPFETAADENVRHIVAGDFGAGSKTDLLVYSSAASGAARFYSVGSTDLSLIGQTSNLRANWTQIVPLDVDGSGYTDLLFYDWKNGDAHFYSTDGSGALTAINTSNTIRKTWRLIVPGDFTSDSGSELLFYDPNAGEIKVYNVNANGTLGSSYSNTGFGEDVAMIIPGEFVSSDALHEVLVYTVDSDSTANGKFYKFDNSGAMTLVNTITFRTSWSQIVSANNDKTALAFYDMSQGGYVFYSVSNGVMTETADGDARRSWSKIVSGDFTSSPGRELLFFDRFNTTNGWNVDCGSDPHVGDPCTGQGRCDSDIAPETQVCYCKANGEVYGSNCPE